MNARILILSFTLAVCVTSTTASGKFEAIGMFADQECTPDGSRCLTTVYSKPHWVWGGHSWKRTHEYTTLVNSTWVIYPYDGVDLNSFIWVEYIDEDLAYVCLNVSDELSGTPIEFTRNGITSTVVFMKGVNYCNYFKLGQFRLGLSTTVVLSVADTENQDDCYLYEYVPGATAGTGATMDSYYSAIGERVIVMRWNHSVVPAGRTIDEVILNLNLASNNLDAGEIVTTDIHHIDHFPDYNASDQVWVEETLNYSDRPLAGEFNATSCGNADWGSGNSTSQRYNITITGCMVESYNGNFDNFSIWSANSVGGGAPSGEGPTFSTKEASGTSNDPRLFIVHSEAGVSDNPPTTALNSPGDASEDTDGWVTFNCSATDDNDVTNISMYHNDSGTWTLNFTNTTSGTWAQGGHNISFADNRTVLWNCLACDNASQCDWADANYTVIINISGAPPCSPSWVSMNESWSAWTNDSCNISDQYFGWRWHNEWFNDTNSCGESPPANNTYYDNRTFACDNCTPQEVNGTWNYEGNTTATPWANVTSCNISGNITQERSFVEWNWTVEFDNNSCYNLTGLEADNFTNITHYDNRTWYEYQIVGCEYEAPTGYPSCPLEFTFNWGWAMTEPRWGFNLLC